MSTTSRTIIGPADHGRRMTLDEFVDADFEGGWLYELARGVIDVSHVPGLDHAFIVDRLTRMFYDYRVIRPAVIVYRAGAGECRVRSPGISSDRHPDQALYLKPPPADVNRNNPWTQWIPDLVVEFVSEGGEHRDYVEKAEEYLAVGVLEYWVLDPSERELLIHHSAGDIWVLESFTSGMTYRPLMLPGLDVRPDDLFGPVS